MRAFLLSIFVSLSALLPSLVVQRTNNDEIIVAINGTNDTLKKCMSGGVEVRYQFEVELCRTRSAWFDKCKGKRDEKAYAKYDPVSESYKIQTDRLDDGIQPELKTVYDAETAFSAINTTRPMSIEFLAHGDQTFLERENLYIRVRGLAYCKEERNQTIETITKFLTTGVSQLLQYNSGWETFSL